MHEARSYSASTKALRQDQSRTAEKSPQAFYKRFSGLVRTLPLEPAGADAWRATTYGHGVLQTNPLGSALDQGAVLKVGLRGPRSSCHSHSSYGASYGSSNRALTCYPVACGLQPTVPPSILAAAYPFAFAAQPSTPAPPSAVLTRDAVSSLAETVQLIVTLLDRSDITFDRY